MNPFLGIALWLLILIVGGIIGSFFEKKKESMGGVVTQLVFIITSVAVFIFLGGLRYFGVCFDIFYTVVGFGVALPIALPLAYLTSKVGSKEKVNIPVDVSQMGILKFVAIALILAPLGEEMLFRGVLETSLLVWGIWIATVIPAILFSLIHIAPFKGSSPKFMAVILFSAFLLGLLSGYFRAISGSLLPAYVVHMTFNLSGRFFNR